MKRKIFSILFALVLVCSFSLVTAVPVAADPAEWYVDATVGSSGDGTSSETAFKTIGEAIIAADTGDTINVAAGIYNEAVTIEKQLTLLGANARVDPTVEGGRAGDESTIENNGITIINADNVTVDGFTITNAPGDAAILVDNTNNNSSNNIIVNNILSYNSKDGIRIGVGEGPNVQGDTSGNTIANNVMSGNGWQGIYLWSSGPSRFGGNTLENNVISDSGRPGIYVSWSDDNTIKDNDISYSGQVANNPWDDWVSGISLNHAHGSTLTGNTLSYQCRGISIFDDSTGNTLTRNTISNNEYGIYLRRGVVTDNEVHHNNIVDNTYGVYNCETETFDATNNWWGSASGPTHASNTYTAPGDASQGDAVSDYVDYVPWLDAASPAGASFAPVALDEPAGQFSSIQAGVTASNPNGTVSVAAGIYNPTSTITISTDNLTLLGPQAGVDPRPSYGSTRTAGSLSEAVIDGSTSELGMIIEVDADDVVINGLEVKSGIGDMIKQNNPHSGTTVKYCIIHDGRGDEGVQLKQCTGGILEYNYVFEIADPGDALNIADTSSLGAIRYNEVAGIHGENAAIYIYGAVHMEIIGNLVRDSGSGGNDGIKVGSKSGSDAALSDVLVKDNIIHGITQDGISVYMSGVTVEGNEIYDCGSENGAIYLAFDINDITIQNNSVHDNVLSTNKRLTSAGILIEKRVDVATVTINLNNIYNNTPYGVTNEASGIVDATDNYWGNASGSTHESNSLGTGDAVSNNVDFEPWLLAVVIPEVKPTTYDKTISLPVGWSLVSPDSAITESLFVSVGGEPLFVLEHTRVGFVTELSPPSPLKAIYVKTVSGGGVGVNYAVVGPGVIYSKDLVAGWNLISVPSTVADTAGILSPLRYVTIGTQQGVGLTTLVSQGEYNLSGVDFYEATLTETHWDELSSLDPFDGYWAYMEAAKTFEVIPTLEAPPGR